MTTICRAGLCLLVLLSTCMAQQPTKNLQMVGGKTVGSGEVISTARIADPNELVGVNGRIVKMSDLASLFSSLDSLEAQNLHIQPMRIGGTSLPTVQLKGPNSSCLGQGKQDQAGSCPIGESVRQDQNSKVPQNPQQK